VFISNGYLTKRNEEEEGKTKWVYGEEGRKTKMGIRRRRNGSRSFFFSSFNCRHGVGILRKKG
jgi:hypothetical protein